MYFVYTCRRLTESNEETNLYVFLVLPLHAFALFLSLLLAFLVLL